MPPRRIQQKDTELSSILRWFPSTPPRPSFTGNPNGSSTTRSSKQPKSTCGRSRPLIPSGSSNTHRPSSSFQVPFFPWLLIRYVISTIFVTFFPSYLLQAKLTSYLTFFCYLHSRSDQAVELQEEPTH